MPFKEQLGDESKANIPIKGWKKIFLGLLGNTKLEQQTTEQEESVQYIPIETLGIDGQEFAPVVDYQHPPIQIVPERIPAVIEELTRVLQSQVLSKEIVEQIRYIDPELTQKAFDRLAEALKKETQKPIVFIYVGAGAGRDVTKKSGYWVSQQLKERMGDQVGAIVDFEEFARMQLAEQDQVNDLPQEYQLVAADDLINSGEQITHLIEKLQMIDSQNGTHFASDLIIAALSSSDFEDSKNMRSLALKSVAKIIRVFRQFTTDDIPSFPHGWRSASLQFFAHRVPDYFFSDLVRTTTNFQRDGKKIWFVDDLSQAPPYDPERFSTGSWSYRKAFEDKNNPRIG